MIQAAASASVPPRAQGYGCLTPARVTGLRERSSLGEILVPAGRSPGASARARGARSGADYEGKLLLLIGLLKGAVFLLTDLMRYIEEPCEVDDGRRLLRLGTESSGVVRILKDLDAAIEGRDVLIVEDIVDSGLTLAYCSATSARASPARSRCAPCSTKPERREVDLPSRYVGFELPDRFASGTASTTPSSTAICPSWRLFTARSKPSKTPAKPPGRPLTFVVSRFFESTFSDQA